MARTSDTNLIKGAAEAYKDYSNLPQVYSGLDKISKKAVEMDKEFKLEEEARKKEQDDLALKEKQIKETQDKNWQNATDQVYLNMGDFNTQTMHNHIYSQLQAIRKDLISAQNSKDRNGEINASLKLDKKIQFVAQVVSFRQELSGYTDAKGVEIPPLEGSNAFTADRKNYELIRKFQDEDFTLVEVDGETKFKFEGDDYTYTLKEIKNKFIPKSTAGNNFMSFLMSAGGKSIDEDVLKSQMDIIVPEETNELRAFVQDPINGSETLKQILKREGDKIKEEILGGIKYLGSTGDFYLNYMTEDGKISDAELDNFLDAVVNPYNDMWTKVGEDTPNFEEWKKFCRKICIEKLGNTVTNAKITGDGINTSTY